MDNPALEVDRHPTGHTHPPQTPPLSPTTERERLRDLVYDQIVRLNLRGLLWEDSATVAEILAPHTRRSPFIDGAVTSHLDTVSCWKGLSYSQASELMVWYHIFAECLTCLVEEALRDVIVEELLEVEKPLIEAFLVPRMLQCLKRDSRRVIDITIAYLVRDMLEQLEQFYAYTDMSRMVSWSSSAGGLWNFLHTFLRNQDCLLETTEGFCIIIDFETTYSASVFHLTGHANWHTPNVKFLNLPANLSGGQEYCIVPSIPSRIRSDSTQGPVYYPDDVCFTVLRSYIPDLHWDATGRCFRAFVPEHTKKSETAETTLSATFITDFPDGVRFERQSRWNLKLSVTCSDPPPSYGEHSNDVNSEVVKELLLRHQALYKKMEMLDSSPALSTSEDLPNSKIDMDWVPSYTATPLSKTGNSVEEFLKEPRSRADSVLDTPIKPSPYTDRTRSWSVETLSRISRPIFAQTANTGTIPRSSNMFSPQKRKVSRLGGLTTNAPKEFMVQTPGYNSPSIGYKRPRRHSETSTSSLPFYIFEDDRNMTPDLKDFSSGRVDQRAAPPSDPSSSSGSGPLESNYLSQSTWWYTKPPPAEPQAIQRRPHVRYSRDSVQKHWGNLPTFPITNLDGSLGLRLESPVNDMRLVSDTEKLQAYIRRNYSEFEERRRRRESGIPSSEDATDDERRAYEKIFLGDSEEEWGSEDDMDTAGRGTEEQCVHQC